MYFLPTLLNRFLSSNKTNRGFLSILIVSLFLSGCCSPIKNPAKDLCTGTKRPYEIKGIRYIPQDHYDYDETGVASWYGPGFHHKPGSCGSLYDMHSYTAAHKTLPIPSVVEVTNVTNGKVLHLVINDRGPFVDNRIIDLSKRAALDLGTHGKGLGEVRVKALPKQSVALANYLQRYGRYGKDPSGRSWDQIYREEIVDRYQENPHHFSPQITNLAYQPRKDVTGGSSSQESDFIGLLNQAAKKSPPPTKSAVSRLSNQHYIQVGQYLQKQHAVKIQQELGRLGKTSLGLTKSRQGQQFFAVRLGPFSSKNQAQKVMETVTHKGYSGITLITN